MDRKYDYRIVDEPNPRRFDALIINPLFIFLAAIAVPIFFPVPFVIKIIAPVIWLLLNSFFLGSPSFWKECLAGLIGVASIFGVLWAWAYFVAMVDFNHSKFGNGMQYVPILTQAGLILTLFCVVSMQSKPFAIRQYLKAGAHV